MPSADKLPFELQARESVLLFTRRHPVYIIAKLLRYTLATLIVLAGLLWLAAATSGLGSTFGKIALVLCLAWLVFWLVKAYFAWYRWVNDIWVVTTQRIVDSTKAHWFDHKMASADLVDVEDIRVHREGLLQTMFKFGDVQCQTAGAQMNFVLAGIPKPTAVLALVDSQRDHARREIGRPIS